MRRTFTSRVGSLAVWTAVLALAAVASSDPAPRTKPSSSSGRPDRGSVARGRYLIAIMGCNDCHTPLKMGANGPEPNTARLLSGHPQDLKMPAPVDLGKGPWVWQGSESNTAFAGPWGVTYATNLTPDPNTGLGIWTEDLFVRAMRTGKHFGTSRPILPPMPWEAYRNATDEDLKSIFAYLRTVAPVKNLVPDYQPPTANTAAK